MVVITENGVDGGLLLVIDHHNGTSHKQTGARSKEESSVQSSASVEPTEDSYNTEDEEHHHYDDDDDDVYQEFEELDFSQLPDTKSIASDDSFYPPDDSLRYEDTPSPEALSFFKACCTNNVIIVKIMIRQGVTEDDVREVDKNNRVSLTKYDSGLKLKCEPIVPQASPNKTAIQILDKQVL